MNQPQQHIDNEGIGGIFITLHCTLSEENAKRWMDEERCVVMTDNNACGQGLSGERVLGKMVHYDKGLCVVQVKGVMTLPLDPLRPNHNFITTPGDSVAYGGHGCVFGYSESETGCEADHRGIILAVDREKMTVQVLL